MLMKVSIDFEYVCFASVYCGYFVERGLWKGNVWLAYKDYIHYYLITRSINICLCVSVCIDTRVLTRPGVTARHRTTSQIATIIIQGAQKLNSQTSVFYG